MKLLLALVLVWIANLPFGYWREGLVRLSPAWFVAIHAPVPLVFLIREWLDLDWRLATLPLFLAAYFAGQWLGGRVRRQVARRTGGN
ncbi:MAG TPA: hypothetical protein PLI48_01885 [Gammaproteobacteria bacterium]|nr:hypothetical protein [Gammaproteobacteria bacterium]HRP87441.1 hypothetical protein [Gammaproteobacteria bacterium]